MTARYPGEANTPAGSRSGSIDSRHTGTWSSRSLSLPRRVESFVALEDAVMYRNQQASQRAAGGAALEQPQAPFASPYGYDRIDRPHDHPKQRSSESVRSADSDASVPLHFSIAPLGGAHQGRLHQEPPAVHEPSRPAEEIEAQQRLAVPPMAYQPSDRLTPGTSAIRNGRSPLARKSFTHLATDSPTGEQKEVEVEVRVPRRASGEEERRGRRGRRSISVDDRGRRRLSKQRPGSREPSTG